MRMGDLLNEYNKMFIAMMVVFVVIFGGLYISMSVASSKQQRAAEQFGAVLERAGLTIVDGAIRSPSVVIEVDTSWEFTITIGKLQQDTIYYDSTSFFFNGAYYVFNDDMTIAWMYRPKASD